MTDFNQADHPEDRGLCKGCKWWQAEHDGPAAEDRTIGLCMHPELTHFSLQVSGHCGCNRFETAAGVGAEQVAVGAVGG